MANRINASEAIDDLSSGSESPSTSPSSQSPTNGSGGESSFLASEVLGDPPVNNGSGSQGESGADDEEVENSGGESGEETFETATTEALAETSGENALSDFEGIEEFEPLTLAEVREESDVELADAGFAISGAESVDTEEFGFLASLIPTLVSTVGPAIVKAVGSKLSPRTRRAVKRRAASAPKRAVPSSRGANQRDRLISLFVRLFESAEAMPVGESSTPIDDSLVESIASTIEVIIGQDDRVRITATQKVPWRRICALRITFPSGKVYRGTGFFIGLRAVATAGHCVYLHNQGGWARSIEVIPAANGSSKPFGTVISRQFRSVRGWVNNRKPEYDYGCVVVPSGSFGGRNLGQFGFGALSSSDLLASAAVLAGYPGDKPFAELWGMARRIKTVAAERLIYDIDTVGGQSGAPVYIKYRGERVVVGIHNYGNSGGNSATRVTQQVYRHLESWRKL